MWYYLRISIIALSSGYSVIKVQAKRYNRIHTSVLRVPYEDNEFPLEINACIHAKNLQTLMIEIYTSINHLSQSLVRKFHEKECVEYNLSLCKLPTIRSTSFGLESLSFRGSFLWNTHDDSVKNEPTLLAFKNKMQNWSGKEWSCRICRELVTLGCDILYIVIWFFCIVKSWFSIKLLL